MNDPRKKEGKQALAMKDRRRFPRFSKQIYLTLYVREENASSNRIDTFRARTIDVGRGGLRIESPREVWTGSRVGFESDDDDAAHCVSSIGEVMWCSSKGNRNTFEFGLSFPIAIEPRE